MTWNSTKSFENYVLRRMFPRCRIQLICFCNWSRLPSGPIRIRRCRRNSGVRRMRRLIPHSRPWRNRRFVFGIAVEFRPWRIVSSRLAIRRKVSLKLLSLCAMKLWDDGDIGPHLDRVLQLRRSLIVGTLCRWRQRFSSILPVALSTYEECDKTNASNENNSSKHACCNNGRLVDRARVISSVSPGRRSIFSTLAGTASATATTATTAAACLCRTRRKRSIAIGRVRIRLCRGIGN